jgi:TatA/E family protein of Tat protein translocase
MTADGARLTGATRYHGAMPLDIILVIALIIVMFWRGPKTLPLLGRAFGKGVREAKREMNELRPGEDDQATGDSDEPKA